MVACAITIHQPPSFGLATNSVEEDYLKLEILWRSVCNDASQSRDNRFSVASPRYYYSKNAVSAESLWREACYDSSWTHKEHCEIDKPLWVATQDEEVALVASLRFCTKNKDLYRGSKLHNAIVQRGLIEKCSDALITMYAKCGELGKACDLLDLHNSRDVITWTALIAGYVREGHGQQALDCFKRMQGEDIPPTAVTYSCVLKACAAVRDVEKGREIHEDIMKRGLLKDDIVLATALLDMYGKCGALTRAQEVLEKFSLRDVVSWNALISGYTQDGQGEQALHCFEHMKHKGILPNSVTYICTLKACASIGAADKGKQIHDEVARQGLLQNNNVLATALVNMYAKCGTFSKAQYVFEKFSSRDAVSWNALITGYVQEGKSEQALSCFEQMQREAVPPDAVTYGCILRACASMNAAQKGEQIHAEIARQGLLWDNVLLGNVLVDMYVKCGALSKAHDVLEELPSRNVVSWSTLIAGYAQVGQGQQALECFECMLCEGIPPDAVTYVCVLSVCSHMGLVEEGHALFANMSTKYGVKPNLGCYFCMVDLFGRAGHVEKAAQLVQEMPFSNYSNIWLILLGACQKWGDVNVGRWAFERAILADENNGPAYVLMANIYAAAGMQTNAKNIEAMRVRNRAWKTLPDSWWVFSSEYARTFPAGNTLHSQTSHKYMKPKTLPERISE